MCERPTTSPGIALREHSQRGSARRKAGNGDGTRVNGTRIHHRHIREKHRENVAGKRNKRAKPCVTAMALRDVLVPRAVAATFCGNWLRVGNDGAALRAGAGKLGEICAASSVTPSGGKASAVRATLLEFAFAALFTVALSAASTGFVQSAAKKATYSIKTMLAATQEMQILQVALARQHAA
jgi:hypothetical protein